jgi:Nuclear transport factor 2 (NTF2) domain
MHNDTDKSATMKQYFACMDSADFVTSAAMFADDAVYIRPPYVPGQAAFASSGTENIEGLPAIIKFWDQRGKRNTHHVIKVEGISGNEWFAEGDVSVDDSETRLFLTHVTFNDKGQIERFVALR